MIENIKEFFHFLAKGRARSVECSTFDPLEARETEHLKLVKSIDELLNAVDNQPIPNAPPSPPVYSYVCDLEDAKHKPHYQLNVSQTARLYHSVKVGDVAWATPMPIPADTKETAEGLHQLNQEMCDLVALDLVKNVSSHFEDKIKHALKLYGRHVQYFAPTELAFQMFIGSEERAAQ